MTERDRYRENPTGDMDAAEVKFYMLARKLRAKAEWDYVDHYYTDATERATNTAKREFAEDIAELLDEAFEFDSRLGSTDHDAGRFRFKAIP